MALFKTSEKDVIKYLAKLSEEERAALLEKIGAADEPGDDPETDENGEGAAEDTAAESAPDGADTAPAGTAEGDGEPADAPPAEDEPEGEETPPDGQEEPPAEPAPAAEPIPAAAETPQTQPGASAEALQALEAKYSAQITQLAAQIEQLNAFVETLKEKDAAEKEGIGYQRAQASRTSGQKSYAELRKETIGY